VELPHNFEVDHILNLWELFDPQSMQANPTGPWKKLWKKVRWTLRRGLRAFRLYREWIRLINYLNKIKPDIIQFGKINFPFENMFLKRLRRNGLVLSQICHEFERRESRGLFARLIDQTYANIYVNFSIIFFHAQENRNRFHTLFPFIRPEKTIVIPHGNESIFLSPVEEASQNNDARKAYGLAEDVPVILFFGILAPSKGLSDLIDAFKIVRDQYTAKLIIAGYPSKFLDLDRLKKQAADLGLEDQIIFDTRYLPFDEIGPLMEMAQVVTYPYHSSTQSGALQVAYAFGRPVIATSVGGLPEVVEDGKSGYLVPPQNPAALARKISLLVEDAELAKKMGDYAQYLSETKYGWKPIAQQVKGVYQKILSEK
jgi:glycosyltransferase involved in cell wall biosynthesis